MENNIIIRKANLEDLKEVADIAVRGWKVAYKDIIDEEYLNSMSVEETYKKIKDGYKKNNYVVAVLNKEVVGFCRYTLNYSQSDDNADGEIIALYVKPELKYNGIGTQMFNYVMQDFYKNENKRVVIGCLKENYPSRKFYEKMGGKVYAEKWFERGGKQYPEVFYEYWIT